MVVGARGCTAQCKRVLAGDSNKTEQDLKLGLAWHPVLVMGAAIKKPAMLHGAKFVGVGPALLTTLQHSTSHL